LGEGFWGGGEGRGRFVDMHSLVWEIKKNEGKV